jgi:membrane-bound inhibitor of C-type lysozyme
MGTGNAAGAAAFTRDELTRIKVNVVTRAQVILPLAALIAGCSHESATSNKAETVDINSAAQQAQGDIDTYAANALQTPAEAAAAPPLPRPTAQPAPAPPASPSSATADEMTPTDERPAAPGSAADAANVVQTYYALIEAGQYRQAWALWDRGGAASGATRTAFAARFAPYRDYHAEIGAPGPIDAGAGQRYVEVPVRVYGHRLDHGRPFVGAGKVILHRTAAIDGATAQQRSWRISAADIPTERPMPAATPSPAGTPAAGDMVSDGAVPATASADYRCDDGFTFHVAFDNRADTATIEDKGAPIAVLHQQRAASGISYRGQGYALRGKGTAATVTRPGHPDTNCIAR